MVCEQYTKIFSKLQVLTSYVCISGAYLPFLSLEMPLLAISLLGTKTGEEVMFDGSGNRLNFFFVRLYLRNDRTLSLLP